MTLTWIREDSYYYPPTSCFLTTISRQVRQDAKGANKKQIIQMQGAPLD
jgi:hypothetical protein